jgi:mRNA interferase MazF
MNEMNEKIVKRGELWFADLNYIDMENSMVQAGKRPVLIIQNDMGNRYSPVVTIIPLSSRVTKKKLPTHVTIDTDSGLAIASIALCEQIQTIDKWKLIHKVGEVDNLTMNEINQAMMIQSGLVSCESKSVSNIQNINREYLMELLIAINQLDKISKLNNTSIKAKSVLLKQFIEHCKENKQDYKVVVEELKYELNERKLARVS